jgi:ABC-type transport system involved in cytochrome c biogenesis permease subunit
MGSSLMMLARRYGMDGDTMPKLAAVLDSNFWLTIHVLTITLGYAAVLASGALGHWHLILLRSAKGSPKEMDAFSLQRGVLGLGLLLTFVGTLLGGVWADQSWGRFWGWDPKENGALIIILWVAFLFHAMPAGFFSKRGFSLGSIFAIQTVLFAWFGVNLMGVGLHSYGFTEGTVRGLVLFALMELAFTLWVVWPARKPTST